MKTKYPLFLSLFLLGFSLTLQAATTPPQLIEGKQPPYPEELKESGEVGEARIKAQIGSSGLVTEASVSSASNEAFGLAALEAVRTWRFKPAQSDGQPVATTVTIPIQFKLSLKDQINHEAGRQVFVDIDELTDKVHEYSDVKKWFPINTKNGRFIPYPESMMGSGISEEIEIWLIISPEGRPLNPSIVNLKNTEFAMPAIRHLVGLRFQKPKLEGTPIYLKQKVKLVCSEDPAFGRKPAK